MFKIFDKPVKVKKKVYLKLVPAIFTDAELSLIAVDEEGNNIVGGTLMEFYPNGTFVRRKFVVHDLGVKLDEESRIVERE